MGVATTDFVGEGGGFPNGDEALEGKPKVVNSVGVNLEISNG